MAPRITEVFHLKVNDKFNADPSIFASIREGAAKAGLSPQYYGTRYTDSNHLFWLMHFDEGKTPETFEWPAEYGDFGERIKEIAASPLLSHFLPFESFPPGVVTAPVTEVVWLSLITEYSRKLINTLQVAITLKPEIEVKDIKPALDASLANVLIAPGCVGCGYSVATNDPRVIYYLVGWNTIEDHNVFLQTEAFKEETVMFQTFMETADVFYTNLTAHAA